MHSYTFVHWWQGCHAGHQPSHQEQIGVKHLATHIDMDLRRWSTSWALSYSGLIYRRSSSLLQPTVVIYLSHFHGNTFGEIPLDVFKVHLCSAACYMWQLRNQRHISINNSESHKSEMILFEANVLTRKIQLKKAGLHDENLKIDQFISDSLPRGTGSASSSHTEPCVF